MFVHFCAGAAAAKEMIVNRGLLLFKKKKKKEKGSIHGMVRITESDFLTEM